MLSHGDGIVEVTKFVNDGDSAQALVDMGKYNAVISKLCDRKKKLTYHLYRIYSFLWKRDAIMHTSQPFTGWFVCPFLASGPTPAAGFLLFDIGVGNNGLHRVPMESWQHAGEVQCIKEWKVQKSWKEKLHRPCAIYVVEINLPINFM